MENRLAVMGENYELHHLRHPWRLHPVYGIIKTISFSDEDELFVLGDAVDRGPEPIRVLRDMMMRPNVTLIPGNHEYIMYKVLSKLAVEITDENSENYLTADDLMDFTYWIQDGGGVTLEQFRKLDDYDYSDFLFYRADYGRRI